MSYASESRLKVTQQNKNDERSHSVSETQPTEPVVVRQSCFGASGEVIRNAVDFEDVLDRLSKGVNVVGPSPRRSEARDYD